ncbi:methionine ABC transporter ATP-binding protein [Mycetocola spongiae]|uniref:methionine ABC transporter ATP-binding protein n=1 Tax=Mycetocola spongiae TaxID=2859226 RepID=UPI001CF2DD48|nr:ATP-binding cassette domain-containing protein [Mycetocola spongiae]UCR89554.1 ATP-binding cassette domain-containing protein [Mycetocola spongiae]
MPPSTLAPPPVAADPMIEFRGVTKRFSGRKKELTALDNVSFNIGRGAIFGIVGYSGAGKSTLLRTINALERPTTGSVLVNGKEINALGGKDLSIARLRIGMIFQQFNLLNSRTVFGNVAYPLRLAGVSAEDTIRRVTELLAFVGLVDKADSYPSQLSGGQKQRVGIARALANRPDVLISDESTSALDPQTTAEVLELLRRVNREYGVTIVLVTHEMEVVRRVCDRVAVMASGRVVEEGTIYEVFSAPNDPTSKRFVSSVLHHHADDASLERIRALHTGRLVTLAVEDRASNDPYLTRAARDNNVDFNVVYGGVSELQGRLFGSLTVELIGEDAAVEATIAQLRHSVSVAEVAAHG